jgi:hypothetical protein
MIFFGIRTTLEDKRTVEPRGIEDDDDDDDDGAKTQTDRTGVFESGSCP